MTAKIYLGLINPKSATNVGAILRASGCYQVDHVFHTGQRYQYASRYHTDTQDSIERVGLTSIDSFDGWNQAGFKTVCVELVEGATALPDFQHPQQAMYLFGPEDGSIPQRIIDQADEVVYIPTIGCLNLAATVNVLLYDRMAKAYNANAKLINAQSKASEANSESLYDHTDLFDGDALIRKSRDQNNRLKVKKFD